jgi:Domain of unknown function (DUF4345)
MSERREATRPPLWILVAGPYATGAPTPAERAANLRRLNEAALELQRRGHLPVIGGASAGADREVERIAARGGRVFRSLAEIAGGVSPRRGTPSRFERGFLASGALVLFAYAVGFVLDPALLGRLVGLAFEDANAFVEIRAFYGGLELGLAGFLAFAAFRTAHTRTALVLFACAFGAAGLARLAGIVEYGFTGPSQPLVAAIELAGAVVALLLARRSP